MGTAIGLDLRDPEVAEHAVDAAFAWLGEVDARFSPFKAASEISRNGPGRLRSANCLPNQR